MRALYARPPLLRRTYLNFDRFILVLRLMRCFVVSTIPEYMNNSQLHTLGHLLGAVCAHKMDPI